MKSRVTSGKTLFPWKTKNGPELKKGLIKVIYLHGMHLSKGNDRLPKIKKLEEKWKFIAEEFWKQPCCELLKHSEEYKDLQAPSHLSVRSEFGHILTEVSNAMHWGKDSLANLSQKEGDLPEYESIVLNILMEQEQEKAEDELKQLQEKGKEQNEVSILLNAFSKSSAAQLKVTSKAIRKRERENQSSSDDAASSAGTSSSGSSKHFNNYGVRAMSYFDKIMGEMQKDELEIASSKPIVVEVDLNENRNMEKLMLRYFLDVEWWQCFSVPGRVIEEDYDYCQAHLIGIGVIVNIFCTKPNDAQFFKNEMRQMQLTYLGSHKLFLKLRDAYEEIEASLKSTEAYCTGVLSTPRNK